MVSSPADILRLIGVALLMPGLASVLALHVVHAAYGVGPEELPWWLRAQLKLLMPGLRAGRRSRPPWRGILVGAALSLVIGAACLRLPFLMLLDPSWQGADGIFMQATGAASLTLFTAWLIGVLCSFERARRRPAGERPSHEWHPGFRTIDRIRQPAAEGRFAVGIPFAIESRLPPAAIAPAITERSPEALSEEAKPDGAEVRTAEVSEAGIDLETAFALRCGGSWMPVPVRMLAAIAPSPGGSRISGNLFVSNKGEYFMRRVPLSLIPPSLVVAAISPVALLGAAILTLSLLMLAIWTLGFATTSPHRATAMVYLLGALAASVDGQVVQAGKERSGIRTGPLGWLVRLALDPPQAAELRKAHRELEVARLAASLDP